ncbi:rhodanese-like domain-containing protein [Methanoculleus sp. FWC-SCC3]|uniref:Rhodanese-like domain-containing protein n=1 Tax=Methanoculleus methanifontis TaxID=2584086 RepID=A0ABT8LXI4_9EURY|nr:rhodanese-like domain-containing protein [Methanoculleus sp. FWC-SCC3]MDN7011485.1 rhodanese-like domain-containing protein [Methanoculleus sp. FWC-SCC3]
MAARLHPLPAFLLVVALVLTSGCLEGSPAPDDGVVRTITPHEASALIEERGDDPGFVIVDVRRPDEFAAGHIPGAININSAEFSEHLDGLDPEATYLIYCQRGVRSAGVRELMRDAEFREVYEIEGGMSAWEEVGLPVAG